MASQKKSITFSDIAQYTGLSKATISRYFNQPSYLTQESIDMISKALKELNYQENKLARVFAKGNSEIIGIIVPNFFYQFYSHFLNHVLNTYEQYGFKFITFLGNNDCEAERKCLNELLAYQIIGLIDLISLLNTFPGWIYRLSPLKERIVLSAASIQTITLVQKWPLIFSTEITVTYTFM